MTVPVHHVKMEAIVLMQSIPTPVTVQVQATAEPIVRPVSVIIVEKCLFIFNMIGCNPNTSSDNVHLSPVKYQRSIKGNFQDSFLQ